MTVESKTRVRVSLCGASPWKVSVLISNVPIGASAPVRTTLPSTTMSSEVTKKRLVLSIIDFLNSSLADGTVKEDDKESLEVAVQCIGEAFGVDPSSPEASKLTIAPATQDRPTRVQGYERSSTRSDCSKDSFINHTR